MNFSQTKEQSVGKTDVRASATTEISKVGVTAIAISASLIGCWALACLFAGLVSEGPGVLVGNLVKAITG